MKWRKHPSDLRDDDQVAEYLNCCRDRHAGYGFFMFLCDLIARKMDAHHSAPTRTMPERSWCRACDVPMNRWRVYVGQLESAELAVVKHTEGKLSVTIPKLADWTDEYTQKVRRKSGQTPVNVHAEENTEEEIRKDKKRSEGQKTPHASTDCSFVSQPSHHAQWLRMKLPQKVDFLIDGYPELVTTDGVPDIQKISKHVLSRDGSRRKPTVKFQQGLQKCVTKRLENRDKS